LASLATFEDGQHGQECQEATFLRLAGVLDREQIALMFA
jgi:hypothetical protein